MEPMINVTKSILSYTIAVTSFAFSLLVIESEEQLLLAELDGKVPQTSGEPNPVSDSGLPAGESCFTLHEDFSLELAAIRPVYSAQIFTSQDNPTLFFHIPYTPDSVSKGEFILRSSDPNLPAVYRDEFVLEGTPGLFSVTLPSPSIDRNVNSSSYLEQENYYRWSFKLYCSLEESDAIQKRVVRGGIRRVASEADLNNLSIHYDHVQSTIEKIGSDHQLEIEWTQLLKSLSNQLADWFTERELDGESAQQIIEAYSNEPISPTNGVTVIQLDK